MVSVLQMSKLNHMANKFDSFLKDTDLNKKFLLWNKWNFTTKEVGEVRKQFLPHLFFLISTAVAQSVPGWRSFQLFFSVWNRCSLWRSCHHTDRGEPQPFPVWGKASKVIQVSRYLLNSQPLSTQRFCHTNSHFPWECWREKCHPEQAHEASGESSKKTNQNLGYWK